MDYRIITNSKILDKDTKLGVNFNNLIEYNSNFFDISERIIFESMVLMFISMKGKEFEITKNEIFLLLGIKKTKFDSTIKRFEHIGILKKGLRNFQINGQPRRKNNYTILVQNVIELLPQIFTEVETSFVATSLLTYFKMITIKV